MTKQKKNFGCLKIILIGFVCVLAVPLTWLAFNNGPLASDGNPLADVSPETTWITEPLDHNGDVDYLEALNLRLSEGIASENNAAVLYTRAFGPCDLDEKTFTRYLKRVGIDGSQIHDLPLVDFDEWFVRKQREQQVEPLTSSDASEDEDPLEQYRYLTGDAALWSAEQFPLVDEWLNEFSDVAKTIRDATKIEQCYFPLIARYKPQVMSALLPHPQKMRHAARYFSISALRHLHDNDFDNFIDDLQCMDQIAQHTAQGATLVEELISIAVKRMILSRVLTACDLGLSTDDLKTLLAFSRTIKPLEDGVSRIDNCERFMALDAAISIGRGESEMGFTYPQAFVDWNETLRVINDERDLLVEKLDVEDFTSRAAGSAEIWNRLEQMERNSSVEFMATTLMGRKSKARWMGKLLTTILTPAFDQVLTAEASLKSDIEMAQIAIAISIYRNEKGELPDSIQQLAPEFLEAIPVEDATGKPYTMSKTDTGTGFRVQSATWIEGAEEAGLEIMIAPSATSFEQFLQDR